MEKKIKWGGYWRIPTSEQKCGGELLIDSKQGSIRLVVFHSLNGSHDIFSKDLFPTEIPLLYGEISNGTKVTLENCKVVNRHSQNFQLDIITIFAESMFVGAEYTNEELLFDGIAYVLSNTIAWSGLCNFSSDISDSGSLVSIKWNTEKNVSVQLRDGVTILFTPHIGSLPGYCTDDELKLTQKINIEFQYTKSVRLEESLKDVRSLIN